MGQAYDRSLVSIRALLLFPLSKKLSFPLALLTISTNNWNIYYGPGPGDKTVNRTGIQQWRWHSR